MYFPVFFLFLSTIALDVTALVTIPTDECNVNPIDIQFILDVGKSVTANNFAKVKDFVKDFVGALEIGSEKTQIGAFIYSKMVYPCFWLNQHTSKDALFAAVDGIPYKQRSSLGYLGNAFSKASTEGFSKARGGRDGVMNVIIVITDGKQITHVELAQTKAERAQNKHVRILTIGVGNTNTEALRQMASDPSRYIRVENFDALGETKEQLLKKTCEVCPFWSGSNATLTDWQCYRFFKSRVNWKDAKSACEAEGTNVTLAELRSEAARDYVVRNTQEVNSRTWLGASDIAEEGKFVWTAEGDEANIDSTWWGANQPDNFHGHENCLVMEPDGKVNDYYCESQLPYFCESADVVP